MNDNTRSRVVLVGYIKELSCRAQETPLTMMCVAFKPLETMIYILTLTQMSVLVQRELNYLIIIIIHR